MPFTYEYPRAAVTTDCVIFSRIRERWHILLIQRGAPPFEGAWALPGGFIEMEETLERSAERELEEETGLTGVELRQFHTFGDPGRDPRGRSVTVAYWGAVSEEKAGMASAGDDARHLEWYPLDRLPELAFDHAKVVSKAIEAAGLE